MQVENINIVQDIVKLLRTPYWIQMFGACQWHDSKTLECPSPNSAESVDLVLHYLFCIFMLFLFNMTSILRF